MNFGLTKCWERADARFYEKAPLERGKPTVLILLQEEFAWFLHEARPQQLVMAFKHTSDRGLDSDSRPWGPYSCNKTGAIGSWSLDHHQKLQHHSLNIPTIKQDCPWKIEYPLL